MAPTRVLVVFGSESGNARMAAKKMKETYQGNFTIIDAVQANDVAGKVATKQLVQDCDVLVVTTSSHGEGDPPDNFASFLLALIKSAKAGDKPLSGLQHCVLGFGESVYETFQNTPRLADKHLEECGSRRLMPRVEIDMDEDESATKKAEFQKSFIAALKTLPAATSKPACDWKVPAGKILAKSESELGGASGMSTQDLIMVGMAVLVAGSGYYYMNYM